MAKLLAWLFGKDDKMLKQMKDAEEYKSLADTAEVMLVTTVNGEDKWMLDKKKKKKMKVVLECTEVSEDEGHTQGAV